jgi:hypothetical protein
VTPLAVALMGLAAGLLAGGVLVPVSMLSRAVLGARSPSVTSNPLAPGVILSEAVRLPPDLLAMTAVFAQKVATGLFGTTLTLREQRLAGVLWHLLYAGLWGVGYALLAFSVAVPAVALSLAYGLAVWVVGPAWLVPAMRLMLPAGTHDRLVTALIIGWHLLYGAVVGLVVEVLRG